MHSVKRPPPLATKEKKNGRTRRVWECFFLSNARIRKYNKTAKSFNLVRMTDKLLGQFHALISRLGAKRVSWITQICVTFTFYVALYVNARSLSFLHRECNLRSSSNEVLAFSHFTHGVIVRLLQSTPEDWNSREHHRLNNLGLSRYNNVLPLKPVPPNWSPLKCPRVSYQSDGGSLPLLVPRRRSLVNVNQYC